MKPSSFARHILSSLAILLCAATLSFAQGKAILGDYSSKQGNDEYKVRVSENADGSFKAQIYWVRDSVDPVTGEKILDRKNPDKALRSVPCDRIVLFDGVRFNEEKGVWDGARIYDPQRGIRAKVSIRKNPDGSLSVKGTLMGISETVVWKRL